MAQLRFFRFSFFCAISATSFSETTGACFAFSVRLTLESETLVEGAAEDAREPNAVRCFQTRLMSFSSKSRQVGMMVSRAYDHTTRTRSSRCVTHQLRGATNG